MVRLNVVHFGARNKIVSLALDTETRTQTQKVALCKMHSKRQIIQSDMAWSLKSVMRTRNT